MTVLLILSIILVLLIIILIFPVKFYFKFNGSFFLTVKIAGITIYSVKPEKDIKKPKPADTESDKQAEKQQEKLFEKLKKKIGFSGAVKEIFLLIKDILERSKFLLSHLLFKKIVLKIVVASDDASITAIEYGAVCSVVYPVINIICSNAKVRTKSIDVNADFISNKPSIDFSGIVVTNFLITLIALIGVFKDIKTFKARNDLL